ncbi:MAG: hypothetical protein K6T78_10015 [Alicyclobacillus sp.]|nr:hypothetical protein [Alicyclobacillus sp.]
MLSQPVIASTIVLALLVVGEVVSIRTRARVPMLLVVLVGYLVLLWTGVFPKNLVDNTSFSTVGSLLVAPTIVHMGTLIPLRVIKREIRALVITLIGLVIASGLILAIVAPVFGYSTAVSGVGPLTGGIIAFLVTTAKLKALGLTALITVPTLILAVQGFVGLPLASNLLRRYARKIQAAIDNGTFVPVGQSTGTPANELAATVEPAAKTGGAHAPVASASARSWIPEAYQTPIIVLFQLFFGGALAVWLGTWTHVNYSIWCLVIGLIGSFAGFYRDKALERANSFGIAMVGIIFVVLPSMNSVTPQMFVGSIPPVLATLFIGTIGLIVGGYIGSRIFKWDPNKGIAVALTALFGFPGDFITCTEVSRTGRTPEERELIFNEILSPMLIGGFTSVTSASVIIASIVMQTLH